MAPNLQKSEKITWTIRIGSFIMSIAIMVSSWFLNQAWTRITDVENAVHKLEIHSAETNGSRVSIQEFTSAKSIIDAERLVLDRRIMRLEESLPVIKESLIDIKKIIEKQQK